MLPSGKIARSAKSTRAKSASRDAAFILKLESVARKSTFGEEVKLAVIGDKKGRYSRARKRAVFALLRRARGKGKGIPVTPGSVRMTPHPRLFDNVYHTRRKHWIGSPWPYTTDLLKAYIAHWILVFEGNFRAFTLNLGGDVERKALAKEGKASRWISQRLNYHLEAALGRSVLYWFRIEIGEGENPYLHLHGELGCSDAEIKTVRKALRKAGGKWVGLTRTQVDTKRKNPDTGWISYAFKIDRFHFQHNGARRNGAKHKPSWRDGRFFIGQELSRAAKAVYEEVRKDVRIETKRLPKR